MSITPIKYEDSDITSSLALCLAHRYLSHCGSTVSTQCGCGLNHFTTARGHGDYEEGEIEHLRNDGKSIEWTEFDTIHTAFANGNTWVVGCRCGRLEEYVNWVIKYAEDWSQLLVDFWQQKRKAAARTVDVANKLIGGLDESDT